MRIRTILMWGLWGAAEAMAVRCWVGGHLDWSLLWFWFAFCVACRLLIWEAQDPRMVHWVLLMFSTLPLILIMVFAP